MFDKFRLKDVLAHYKQNFVSTQWGNEKYKWEAVKWFQDNWDVNAQNFPEMLSRSLDKTFNLLASINNFPRRMIVSFSKAAPEEVQAMFIALFDENKDVYERMNAFKLQASILLERYGNGAAQHYQYENAISTYLWLRYPDKYYIYKFGEVKNVANELETDYRFKKGAYADNIRNFLRLYNEISLALKEDTELVNLFQSQLTDTCYPDPELKTLTIDVGFYISRFYSQQDENAEAATEWYGTDYNPGLTIEDWKKLLKDGTIFTTSALEIMRRIKDYGGQASCTQLAVKYGETKNFYNSGSVALAHRVCEAAGIKPATREDGSTQWWTVLYTGRDADKGEDGSFIWKLRDELSEALDQTDLSNIELCAAAAPEEDHGYWWLNANPRIWSFSDIAVGEVQSYTLYNENGNKRRIFQNFLDAKVGDMIIGYESNPVKQIVAIGRISAEQDGEKLFFEKIEGLTSPIDYTTLKECPELERMEYFQNPQGSLFKLTRGEYDFILDMIREENPITAEASIDAYTKSDFLDEVYMSEKRYENLVAVLHNKKNIILQGAPGVGKTFAARRLAWSMMGEKDDSRIEFVQFHQNYSYEDLVLGYKPVENSFELKYGIFYRFCQKAANQPDKEFFFIIDEINRGNMCSATRFLRNSDRILEKKAPVLRNISEARSLASAAPKTAGRPTQEGGLFRLREGRLLPPLSLPFRPPGEVTLPALRPGLLRAPGRLHWPLRARRTPSTRRPQAPTRCRQSRTSTSCRCAIPSRPCCMRHALRGAVSTRGTPRGGSRSVSTWKGSPRAFGSARRR